MAANFDPSEFIDDDFQAARKAAQNPFSPPSASPGGPPSEPARAPSREEVETRVTEMHQKLAELRQAQQELERERSALEELRRRQVEFGTGRQEMLQQLTRGVGLLEEAEFTARRDAEQMAKTLAEFRDHLVKIQAVQEDTWTKDNLNVELTRALTTIENARMEWNAARLKFAVLSGAAAGEGAAETPAASPPAPHWLQQLSWWQLCKLGLAFTWPLVLIGLAGLLFWLLR